jgi:hypothetical protein
MCFELMIIREGSKHQQSKYMSGVAHFPGVAFYSYQVFLQKPTDNIFCTNYKFSSFYFSKFSAVKIIEVQTRVGKNRDKSSMGRPKICLPGWHQTWNWC